MPFRSTKTYGHELGLSTAFRQHKAESHCRSVHGYALSFKFTFEADTLDENGWVVDFGGLKVLKRALCDLYDHRLVVAESDAELLRLLFAPEFKKERKQRFPIFNIRVVAATGCEAFAKEAFEVARVIVDKQFPHARVVSCEVSEHGGNSAIYLGEEK